MSFAVIPLSTVHEETQYISHTLEHTRACIVGPHAYVVDAVRSGTYETKELTCAYPDLPKDAVVDLASVKVILDAQLCYYEGDAFTSITNFPDRIIGPDTLMSTCTWNNRVHARAAKLKSRNVQIGDIVGIHDGDIVFYTTVVGLATEPNTVQEPDIEQLVLNVPPTRMLLLQNNLPVSMRNKDKLRISLYIHKTIELAHDKYTRTKQDIALPGALCALDSQWFEAGQPLPLPITKASITISYRAWVSTYADKVYSTNFDHMHKVFPPAGPDNPLVYGVGIAARNAGELPVDFIAVSDPTDLASWSAALFKIKKSYGIVALSDDPEVLALVRKFVHVRSQAETGRECVAWQPLQVAATEVLADCAVTIHALPAGGFVVETENGNFMVAGVREGDMARINDIDCVVDAAMNEDTVLIAARGELPEEARLVIWRKRSPYELAHALGVAASEIGDKRIRAVWPDQFVDDKHRNAPGYFLCAALAGLRSGTAIQQDLTSVQLAGVAAVPRTVGLFEEVELDMMAELGVWVITEVDSIAITRGAVTTADSQKLEESNESVVTNLDMINKVLRAQTAEIITTVRATAAIQIILRNQLNGKLQELAMVSVPRLGPQIIESEITSLRRHVVLENNLVLSLRLVLPVKAGSGVALGRIEVRQKLVA